MTAWRGPFAGLSLALGAALVAAAADAVAAELTWGGSLSTRAESIGNPSLTVPAGKTALRLSLAADMDVAARTGVLDSAMSGRISRSLSNERTLDVTDAALDARIVRRFERDSVSLSAGYRRDSTLASELQSTGILLARAQRDSYSLGAAWQRTLGERLSANLGLSLGALRYERSGQTSGLVDSDTARVTTGLTYALSPRSTLGVSAGASSSDTQPFTTDSRSVNLQATFSHSFSDRLSFSGAYGPSRTRIQAAALARVCALPGVFCELGLVPFTVFPTNVERVSRGEVFDLAASYRAGPETALTLGASRSENPSGSGLLARTDSLSAALSRRLSERWSLSADAAVTRAATLDGLADSRTRSRRVSANLSWAFSEFWQLEGGFRAQQVELPGGPSPSSAALYLGLRYSLPRRLIRGRRRRL